MFQANSAAPIGFLCKAQNEACKDQNKLNKSSWDQRKEENLIEVLIKITPAFDIEGNTLIISHRKPFFPAYKTPKLLALIIMDSYSQSC